MATANKAGKKINSPVDNLRKTTTKQLNNALGSLKEKLGEKNLKRELRKLQRNWLRGSRKPR
ncbi:MAG: hypothetical protein IPL54_04785 [Chitinophagaceae bacterium]|nr:hypothetical protein [Chitinophagaceae bacterium]